MAFDLISRLVFPAPPSTYTAKDFPEELIWIPKSLDPHNKPEEAIPCLFLTSPSARFVALYLHSNAEDLGRCYGFCSMIRTQFQVHVLAVEYPGYGLCPGQPEEDTVTENANVAFRFIHETLNWPLDGILIFGRSIGTGPAIAIAEKNQVYGVVAVSPFLSVQSLCRDVVGPLARFVADRFPNMDRVPLIRSMLLVVHGKKDTVVPVSHGQQLYASCRSRKMLVCPDEMEHNSNLLSDPSYLVLPMLHFFALPDYCFEEIKVPKWVYTRHSDTGENGFFELGLRNLWGNSYQKPWDTWKSKGSPPHISPKYRLGSQSFPRRRPGSLTAGIPNGGCRSVTKTQERANWPTTPERRLVDQAAAVAVQKFFSVAHSRV